VDIIDLEEEDDTVCELKNVMSKSGLHKGESAVSLKSKKSKVSDGKSVSSKSKVSKGNAKGTKQNTKTTSKASFSIMDPPAANFNKTMRQLGIQNPNKLNYLHESFENIMLKIKKRKVAENQKEVRASKIQWKIPYNIIAFI
jgi:hypothetical protein